MTLIIKSTRTKDNFMTRSYLNKTREVENLRMIHNQLHKMLVEIIVPLVAEVELDSLVVNLVVLSDQDQLSRLR